MANSKIFATLRGKQAKLVCIDLQPYVHTQAAERADVLNVGGFSDAVFEVVSRFAAEGLDAAHWVGAIDAVPVRITRAFARGGSGGSPGRSSRVARRDGA